MPDGQEGSTRESELLVKATENPTEVIPPHIMRTLHTKRHMTDLR